MSIKIDFKEFKKYSDDLKKLNRGEVHKFNESAVKELAKRLLAKVIKRTPKYKNIPGDINKHTGGHLQKSWTIGNVVKVGNEYVIEVINTAHVYASYVEEGHRGVYIPTAGKTLHLDTHKTEPVHMMKISGEEIEKDAPKIIEHKLDIFLRSVLNA